MKKEFLQLKMESLTKCREKLDLYMALLPRADPFVYLGKEIPYENLSDSLKLFFCFTLVNYENEFRRQGNTNSGPESLSINSIGNNVIDVFLENKVNIITIFAREIAYERNLNLNIQSFQEYAVSLLKDNLEKNIKAAINSKTPEIFGSLLGYMFKNEQSPGKILEEIIVRSVQIEQGFFEGMVIGEYTISKKLSDKVWKVQKQRKFYAMRAINFEEYFQEDEKTLKKTLTTIFNPGKAQKMKEYSIQYKNRLHTQSIKSNIAPLLDVIYSLEQRKICEIVPFYENTLENTQNHDKSLIIDYLVEFCDIIHSTGYIYNNLCPDKIAYEVEKNEKQQLSYKFILFDLKYMSPIFSMSYKNSNTGYESLNILKRKFYCNIYDDVESIFYIVNYMNYGVHEKFENEIESKKNLDFCSFRIIDAISALRRLRFLDFIDENPKILEKDKKMQNTDYIFAENTQDVDFRDVDDLIFDDIKNDQQSSLNIESYIKELYKNKKVLNPEIYLENSEMCIVKLFYFLSENLKEVVKQRLFGTKLQEEIYARFFEQEVSNNFKDSDEISKNAVERTFEFLYGVSYK